jgi:hypothetical protein
MKAIDTLDNKAELMVPFLLDLIEGWTNYSIDIVYEASRIASKFEPATTPHLVVRDGRPQLIVPRLTQASE